MALITSSGFPGKAEGVGVGVGGRELESYLLRFHGSFPVEEPYGGLRPAVDPLPRLHPCNPPPQPQQNLPNAFNFSDGSL